MNKRDTGFRKRACKKRTKQNCHLFWREMISKLPRQYTHMITRDTTYETIFFATKHSTWLLFVNTQLGLHHITCFKPYPPQSAEWTIWVHFLRCDAFLFLPLIVVSELQLQLCWSAVSKWSYDVRAFGLPIYLKKLQVYEKGMVILHLLRVGWKQVKVHSFNSMKKGNVF